MSVETIGRLTTRNAKQLFSEAAIGWLNPRKIRSSCLWGDAGVFWRMLKQAVQQGRSERRGESYSGPYGEPLRRCENDAGGLFQHPLKIA